MEQVFPQLLILRDFRAILAILQGHLLKHIGNKQNYGGPLCFHLRIFRGQMKHKGAQSHIFEGQGIMLDMTEILLTG